MPTVDRIINALPIGVLVVGLIFCALVYFVPTFVAIRKRHYNTTAIVALNLLLGWTFAGWAVALVWSLAKSESLRGNYVEERKSVLKGGSEDNALGKVLGVYGPFRSVVFSVVFLVWGLPMFILISVVALSTLDYKNPKELREITVVLLILGVPVTFVLVSACGGLRPWLVKLVLLENGLVHRDSRDRVSRIKYSDIRDCSIAVVHGIPAVILTLNRGHKHVLKVLRVDPEELRTALVDGKKRCQTS